MRFRLRIQPVQHDRIYRFIFEIRIKSEVSQRLVSVVSHELLNVVSQSDLVVQVFGVGGLILVEFRKQFDGKVAQFDLNVRQLAIVDFLRE